MPTRYSAEAGELAGRLQAGEGGAFAIGDDLLIAGDNDGLLAAAEDFSARAPFIWRPAGQKLTALAQVCGTGGQLTGVTYLKGKAGVQRAFLACPGAVTQEQLDAALKTPVLAGVHQVIAGAATATSAHELPAMPAGNAGAGAGAAGEAATAAGGDAENAAPARLDLATLYTMHGLFRGTPRMPIPSNLDSHLYVPAGAAGVAMANLAARMGLETTGITLPLATPAAGATAKEVRTKSVLDTSSPIGQEAERKFLEEDTASHNEPGLTEGEGEVRVVDKAFGKQPAVLVRGSGTGSEAAITALANHFPNLWEPGKQFASLEEVRYDLHRFFSLRSSSGQAAFALYRLDQWADEVKKGGPARDVEAKVYVDIAGPGLTELIRSDLQAKLGVNAVKVDARSLHAGTQCCEKLPALHYREPGYAYHQGTPVFQEDLVIPWEGRRLLDTVRAALPKLKPGGPVTLTARVSEGPEERRKLKGQLQEMLSKAGAKDPQVQVICAYKPGLSWLMDVIAPQVKGKAASLKIEFRKNRDGGGTRAMYSPARWVQELYPVDELLAKELGIPLGKIAIAEFEAGPGAPTYRVSAADAAGKEILRRDFTVTTVETTVQRRHAGIRKGAGGHRLAAPGVGFHGGCGPPHSDRHRRVLGPLPQGHAA